MTASRTIAIIPARGGSKGVPGKNAKLLAGRPMLEYTIIAALNAQGVDQTIVSTDDHKIAKIAERAGAKVPFLRPAELASDQAATEPVVSHALELLNESYDQLVLLQPTSPLRTSFHIEEALKKYHETEANSLVSVYPTHNYRWIELNNVVGAKQTNYGGHRGRRQDRRQEWVENGAIYITDVKRFKKHEDLITGHIVLYKMARAESFDIDTPFDFWLTEQIMKCW